MVVCPFRIVNGSMTVFLADGHSGVDEGRSRVDDGDAGEHQLLDNALLDRCRGGREPGPVLDAHASIGSSSFTTVTGFRCRKTSVR